MPVVVESNVSTVRDFSFNLDANSLVDIFDKLRLQIKFYRTSCKRRRGQSVSENTYSFSSAEEKFSLVISSSLHTGIGISSQWNIEGCSGSLS